MDKIDVVGILPANAHLRLSDAKEYHEAPGYISTHRPTLRGFNNALKSRSKVIRLYHDTRGNMAACSVWLEYKGQKIRGGVFEILKHNIARRVSNDESFSFDDALAEAKADYQAMAKALEQFTDER